MKHTFTHTVTVKPVVHRGTDCFGLYFPYHADLIEAAKSIGCTWSASMRCWYLSNNPQNLRAIFSAYKGKAWVDKEALFPDEQEKRHSNPTKAIGNKRRGKVPEEVTAKLIRQRYSKSTVGTYTSLLGDFLGFHEGREPQTLERKDVLAYIDFLVQEKGVSRSTQNQAINAIKFYFEKVLSRPKESYEIERPRKEQKLPKVLSRSEVKKMLAATNNLKHRCIIATLYGCGLRMGELLSLRWSDINMDDALLYVRGGKGAKDRTVILPESLKGPLMEYREEVKHNYWVFQSPKGGTYSAQSVRAIVKKAARLAGLSKSVHPHMLRHSYATHLLDAGASTRHIQALLGHASPKTTEIYTHLSTQSFSKIKSPLDRLDDP